MQVRHAYGWNDWRRPKQNEPAFQDLRLILVLWRELHYSVYLVIARVSPSAQCYTVFGGAYCISQTRKSVHIQWVSYPHSIVVLTAVPACFEVGSPPILGISPRPLINTQTRYIYIYVHTYIQVYIFKILYVINILACQHMFFTASAATHRSCPTAK